MKPILITLHLLLLTTVLAGKTISGTIKDQAGNPIPYATITLLGADSTVVTGVLCNENGHFAFEWVKPGAHTLQVSFVGYVSQLRPISITDASAGQLNLGDILLAEDATQLKEAVVKVSMIRRRADGYTFNPAGSQLAVGRNSLELLSYAPGVWYSRSKGISINGRGGIMVMVNNRELKMSSSELAAYLENLNAEQVQSIEVIPYAGAQYDASAVGGVIKITLKRQTTAGLRGSLGVNLTAQEEEKVPLMARPSLNLDFRKDKLSLYTNMAFTDSRYWEASSEDTKYQNPDQREIDNRLRLEGKNKGFWGKLGGVYELTDKHSIGLDVELSPNSHNNNTKSFGKTTAWEVLSDLESYSKSEGDREWYNASANYRLKTDKKGSNLFIVTDYMVSNRVSNEENYSAETPSGGSKDENHRFTNQNNNTNLYTIRADYMHYLGKALKLETGAKYAYTDMNTTLYNEEQLPNESRVPLTALNDHYLYREDVLAGYINATADIKKWSLVAGLRVENTKLNPHSYVHPEKNEKQSYTDFFPTVRAAYFINKDKGHMLSAGYNRKLRRPGFNELNPYTIQLNNYTYIIGNPDMKPSYTDSYSLTATFANKYSLTLGVEDGKDVVNQIVVSDPNNPEILYYQHANIDQVTTYLAAADAAINPAKWWRLGVSATYFYSKNRVKEYNLDGGNIQGKLNNLFTLPKSWSTELNYEYTSGGIQGNAEVQDIHALNASVKKVLFSGKLTLSLFANNLTDNGTSLHVTIQQPNSFTKLVNSYQAGMARTYGLSARWNFSAGKKDIRIQRVTSGNKEEQSR